MTKWRYLKQMLVFTSTSITWEIVGLEWSLRSMPCLKVIATDYFLAAWSLMALQQPRRHKLPSEICVSRQLEPILTFTATFLNNYLRSSSLASARQRRSSLLKFLKLKQFSPLRRKSSGLEVERVWAQAQRPGLAVNKPQAQGSTSLISGKAQIRLKPEI